MTTIMQPYRPTLPQPMVDSLRALVPQVRELLPADIGFDAFRAALYLELSGNADLATCAPTSLRDAVLKAALHGLLPGRDCHVIPFRSGKAGERQATLVPSYFGVIRTLERSGKISKCFAHAVYTGDVFECDYLADIFRHTPAAVLGTVPGSLRFFYGCIKLKDGTTHLEVMTLDQIDAIRRRAPAHDSGPWVTDFEQMARKTALKRVAKYAQLTPQQQQLFTDDEERERADIPPERVQQHIADLYGDPPSAVDTADERGTRGGATLRRAIEDIHRGHGRTPAWIVSWWAKVVQERGVTTVEALPLSVLTELHASLKRYYHGGDGEEAQRQEDASGTAEDNGDATL